MAHAIIWEAPLGVWVRYEGDVSDTDLLQSTHAVQVAHAFDTLTYVILTLDENCRLHISDSALRDAIASSIGARHSNPMVRLYFTGLPEECKTLLSARLGGLKALLPHHYCRNVEEARVQVTVDAGHTQRIGRWNA